MSSPHFACALSVKTESAQAIRDATAELEAGLEGNTPDLLAAFATHHHGTALEDLGPRLARATGAKVVIGCTAESVIGGAREIEGRPGLALWAAALPRTEVRYFEVSASCAKGAEPELSALPAVEDEEHASMLVVADPFTFPVDAFLSQINERAAGVPAMGGMASGAMGPGQTLLFTADGVRESGLIGVVIEGAVELKPVVSQGCRPVGRPWVITDCDRNLIKKLGGRPAIEVLMETVNSLPSEDQQLIQGRPFLGLAIDPTRTKFERGDFLVRGIIGQHPRDRAIAVADFVRRGQTVQLLVRDSAAATEELLCLMTKACGGEPPARSPNGAGALIFSCNGRGSRMFQKPDHDAGCVRLALKSDVPIGGFFAAGEIGPVGGRNFLHGFTASVALFRERPGA